MESGRRAKRGVTMCLSMYVCILCALCVCLWELNLPFYAVWPRRNIANIVVKGELHKETIQCGPDICKSALQYHNLTAFPDRALL